MDNSSKIILFEQTPIGKAVAKLAVPTILSSLVMVLYNLADTYFVGILNDPVQNAAVALAAPVLLAFNAVNNLFGIGSSSMMSRALGSRNYENAYRSSAFGFYCTLLCGLIFSTLCILFNSGLLTLLGADSETAGASAAYIKWTGMLWGYAGNFECGFGLYGEGRGGFPPCQHRDYERLLFQYPAGPVVYSSRRRSEHGGRGSGFGYFSF